MRNLLKFIAKSTVVVGVVGGVATAAGYYIHKTQFQPIYGLAERVEAKFRRELSLPSDTVGFVKNIETIFLNMKGTVHTMPGQDFQGGGALAIWDNDVLALHNFGRVFYLDGDNGLQLSELRMPDNGKDDLFALGETEKYAAQAPKANPLRYHDIEFVDEGEYRGLLASYTFIDGQNECYRARVSWLPLDNFDSIRDFGEGDNALWETLYDANPCVPFNESGGLVLSYMGGGRMAFKAPDQIYLGIGDYHREGIYRPDIGIQDDNSDYGKTIEISLSTGEGRVYSKGHRNLQGMAVDSNGQIWTTEHGMRGGDELNLIVEGENYGWPFEDMGTLYSGIPAPSIPGSGPGRHVVYKAPVFGFVPSAAISTVEAIDNFHETWDGDLLIGSLKNRTMYRARVQDERLISLEPIPIGQRIRDIMQWDKRLVLWLDTNELVVLEIEASEDQFEGYVEDLSPVMGTEMAESTASILEGCAECHSYKADIHGAGPSLHRIVNSDVASTAFAYYSDELKAVPGSWDRDSLAAFLHKPDEVAPGTVMGSFAISDPDVAAALIDGLEWLSRDEN